MLGLYTSQYLGLDSYNHRVYDTRIRSYCVSANTCNTLGSTLETIYNMDARGWDSRGVNRSSMVEIKDLLAQNKYVLSSILYYVIKDYPFYTKPTYPVEHHEFHRLLHAEYRLGHSHWIVDYDSNTLFVSKAGTPLDLLVYMALAAHLLTLIGYPQNVSLEDLETDHYNDLDNMDNICRIYKIDLSISKIEKTKVLNTIINTQGLTTIEKHLISIFVNLPISHLNGKLNECSLTHIPVIGELTHVLFHIFLISEFDAKFRKLYPRIPFYRLGAELIIPIHDDNDYLDPSKLLEEFHLFGTIDDLETDDTPYYIPCTRHERKVLTLSERKITVWRAEDF